MMKKSFPLFLFLFLASLVFTSTCMAVTYSADTWAYGPTGQQILMKGGTSATTLPNGRVLTGVIAQNTVFTTPPGQEVTCLAGTTVTLLQTNGRIVAGTLAAPVTFYGQTGRQVPYGAGSSFSLNHNNGRLHYK